VAMAPERSIPTPAGVQAVPVFRCPQRLAQHVRPHCSDAAPRTALGSNRPRGVM
jgi:hypothetical protein